MLSALGDFELNRHGSVFYGSISVATAQTTGATEFVGWGGHTLEI